ncbi:condensation domain-containing protein [Actinosynnema sp. NPDC020468]|uniref:condensation domain-containing protein n=1 Tax=Actinosynnema sp. NPDC020468 TaxID=3154488 RepID=UPI0033C55071
MTQIPARFPRQHERSGPLASGHANILRAIDADTDKTRDILAMVFPVPDLPPARVVELVEVVLARHESLRTTYHPGPVQRVRGEGAIAVDVVEAEEPLPAAEALAQRWRGVEFDLAAAPPLRIAVVTSGGVGRRLVWVVSHLAMDVATCELLFREWTALTAGTPLPDPAPQPLDLVELERKPAVARLRQAAVGYWESLLDRVPQTMFTTGGDAPRPGLRVRSERAAEHLAAIAARTGASASTVLLAAIKALVAHRTGHSSCVTTSLSGNRNLKQLRNYFGTVSQDSLVWVPVPADGTFDALVAAVRAATLPAYRAAWFDPEQVWKAISAASDRRGIRYARDLVFNDMSPLAGADDEVVDRGARRRLPAVWVPGGTPFAPNDGDAQFERLPAEPVPCRLIAFVYRLDAEVDVALHADTACLDEDELAEFARALLAVLRAAAARDVPLTELVGSTALRPVARDGRWRLVDSCWVDLDAARATATALLGDRFRGLEAVPDAVLGHRLVCHLAGEVADIRERFLNALGPTVVAPHEYVVREEEA